MSWTDHELSTARPVRGIADVIAEESVNYSATNLKAPSYREIRNSRGLADITIPPPPTALTDSETVSLSPISTNLSIDVGTESSTTQTTRRKRNVASPVDFHFPPSNNVPRPRNPPIRPSPPSSGSPAFNVSQYHHATISLDDLRPSAHSSKSSIGISETQSSSPLGGGLKAKRPSLNRQASVAVMETVGTPSPRLPVNNATRPKPSRDRPSNLGGRADADSLNTSLFRPGTKLKEVLKVRTIHCVLIHLIEAMF